MIRIESNALRNLVGDIFIAAGCSEEEGRGIAKCLVTANLVGHDSHGVARVPRYVEWKQLGYVLAGQKVEVVVDTPVLAVVDGKSGFGQTVAPQAVAIGIAKCKAMGLSAVALRNAGHVGRVGDWSEMAAAEGLVSIHFVNAAGSVLVAPYGGVERRLSTAPYSVGIPRPGQDPLILDFATSIVAEGKVMVASQGGKKIPGDALIDNDGRMSDDPHVLYGDYEPAGPRNHFKGTGAIRAFGEHKGSGLAFMCELLGGSLTGNEATGPGKSSMRNGMFSIYVDPARLEAEEFFPADVARYIAYVKSSKPATPGGEVLLPGEPEARNKAERQKNGIPLPDDTWTSIVETARALGIDAPRNVGMVA